MITGQPASKSLNDRIHKGSLCFAVIQYSQMILVKRLGTAEFVLDKDKGMDLGLGKKDV